MILASLPNVYGGTRRSLLIVNIFHHLNWVRSATAVLGHIMSYIPCANVTDPLKTLFCKEKRYCCLRESNSQPNSLKYTILPTIPSYLGILTADCIWEQTCSIVADGLPSMVKKMLRILVIILELLRSVIASLPINNWVSCWSCSSVWLLSKWL